MHNSNFLVREWWKYMLSNSYAWSWPKVVANEGLYERFVLWGEWKGFFTRRTAPTKQSFVYWMYRITGAKRAQKTVDGKRVRAARFDTISKHKEMFIHG